MSRKIRKISLIIIILLGLLACFAGEVFPRAGSGQKYRAPSRSSGSSSFSGSRSSSSGSRTFRFNSSNRRHSGSDSTGYRIGGGTSTGSSGGCCGAGSCMSFVFFLAVIAVIILLSRKKGTDNTGSGRVVMNSAPSVSALPDIDEEKVAGELAQLKEKDSFFSEKVFLDKAQTAFFEIQRAWSRNDLEPVRKFMSEAQFNRMEMQLSEYKDKGWVNKVEDLVIGGIKIAGAGIEGEYDFIKTRVHASMSDKTFDKDGRMVEGSNEITPMAEYWTFIRKQGAKTNQDGGRTVSHNCPSCGAPVETGESGKCPYCDATITTASFDWVLDTITQSVEE